MSDGSTSAASAERVELVRLTSQRRKDLVQKFSALAGLIVLIAVFGVDGQRLLHHQQRHDGVAADDVDRLSRHRRRRS